MSPFSKNDISYMQMALSLAAKGKGKTAPNPMVGAVVVNKGQVVGRGFHARAGEAHAEVRALLEAGEHAQGATLYVNLEPCNHHGRTPPCSEAIIQAGISRVVAAMEDPNPLVQGKGVAKLKEDGIKVDVGCLYREARQLNEFFVVYHELKRPFVTLKWAMTLCGRTSHDTGHARWISNSRSREYVHQMRALHDAILIGIGTVLVDDPILNVRLENYSGKQPTKVIIDGDLSLPTRSRLMQHRDGGEVVLVTTPYAKQSMIRHFEEQGCKVIVIPSRRRVLDMKLVLDELARHGIMSVLVEGGRKIHTSLMNKRLADKIVAFCSPKLVGGRKLCSPLEDMEIQSMEEAVNLINTSWQAFDDDLCIEGYLREI